MLKERRMCRGHLNARGINVTRQIINLYLNVSSNRSPGESVGQILYILYSYSDLS